MHIHGESIFVWMNNEVSLLLQVAKCQKNVAWGSQTPVVRHCCCFSCQVSEHAQTERVICAHAFFSQICVFVLCTQSLIVLISIKK